MVNYLFSILLIISFWGCSDSGNFNSVKNEIQPLKDKLYSSNIRIQQESQSTNSIELGKTYQSMNSCINSLNQFIYIMDRADQDIKEKRDTYDDLRNIISTYLKKMQSDQKIYLEYLKSRESLSIEIPIQIDILNTLDKVFEKYTIRYEK